MHVRRIAITATLGMGLVVAAAGPALAAPPTGASCQGQFNGYINPLYQGTGQFNKQGVAEIKAAGLNPGLEGIVPGAQLHDVDCAYVPEDAPTP